MDAALSTLIRNPDYNLFMDVQQRVNLDMMRRFARQDIRFAHPIRTVAIGQPVAVQVAAAETNPPSRGTDAPASAGVMPG